MVVTAGVRRVLWAQGAEAIECEADVEPGTEEGKQWVAAEFMLWNVGRQVDRARRVRWRKLTLTWEAELHDAWQRRDMAACHRLILLIVSESKVAKWRSVAGQIPGRQQWSDFLAKEGCDGGMRAHEVDFDDEVRRLHGELDDGPMLQAKHVEHAQEKIDLVGRYMVGATKRKCQPAGSPPLRRPTKVSERSLWQRWLRARMWGCFTSAPTTQCAQHLVVKARPYSCRGRERRRARARHRWDSPAPSFRQCGSGTTTSRRPPEACGSSAASPLALSTRA